MSQASSHLPAMTQAHPIPSTPLLLTCGVQSYDWGERGPEALIPRLLGRAPEPGKAYAELWVGDHPSLPALALLPGGGVPLSDVIRAAPEAVLGADLRRRFGDRLPFLMKVLTASRALSIQAHPDKARAREGFAREEAAGLPLKDPRRSYKDDNHKPELLIALTPFWGLKGFRPLEEIAGVLEREAPELAPLLPDFRGKLSRAEGAVRRDLLKALYGKCMSLPQPEVNAVLAPLLSRLRASGPYPPEAREHWVLAADADYSRGADKDRGLFSLYLLNLVRLDPGQALYLGPGELHAYLKGAGVEVMAASDNVLRGGLTTKHVDIPELLGALTFEAGPPEILAPGPDGVYPTPAPEFEVAAAVLAAGAALRRPGARGPDLWLATEGEAGIRFSGGEAPLRPANPVFVPRSVGGYAVTSTGGAVLHRASVPGERG